MNVDTDEHEGAIPDLTPELTPEQLAELGEEMEAELEHTRKNATLHRTNKRNYDALQTILSEYFDCFLVLAYTAEGDEIVYEKSTTPKDERALDRLVQAYVAGDISMEGYFFDDGEEDEDEEDEDE